MASVHLLWTFDAMIPASTIRTWGERGYITRQSRGKLRYDLDEVIDYAREKGLLGNR